MSQQPASVTSNVDRRGNPQPGRQYHYAMPKPNGIERRVTIRDDAGGHNFGSNDPQNRGPHFNHPSNRHFEY
ncbi:HNH/endonuclease VII fold putative polymorphic toxin [Variovorax sp. WS11]|uniref:HNH/endonuclease VII fold putative polymorphic toxin n=1 Tax=Variovorax sp. WS11 TaxID=1105204 RepID=UPI0035BFB7E2